MKIATAAVLLCGAVLASAGDSADPFQQRLAAYVKLRNEATSRVPALKKQATPEEIQQRELALAEALRKARPNAKQGSILAPDIVPVFHRVLRQAFSGSKKHKMRASIKEGNPTAEKAPGEIVPVLKVNEPYPKNSPLSTVPPSLLEQLPKLPKDLEYRFVGRALVLHDRESNLIVDFLKEAVPST